LPEPIATLPVLKPDEAIDYPKEPIMIRTLIFGAIAGYVGKKLYDEGKLTEFKDDLVTRYNQAKADLADKRDSQSATDPTTTAPASTPASTRAISVPAV
jgi:hypothetical protein